MHNRLVSRDLILLAISAVIATCFVRLTLESGPRDTKPTSPTPNSTVNATEYFDFATFEKIISLHPFTDGRAHLMVEPWPPGTTKTTTCEDLSTEDVERWQQGESIVPDRVEAGAGLVGDFNQDGVLDRALPVRLGTPPEEGGWTEYVLVVTEPEGRRWPKEEDARFQLDDFERLPDQRLKLIGITANATVPSDDLLTVSGLRQFAGQAIFWTQHGRYAEGPGRGFRSSPRPHDWETYPERKRLGSPG